MLIIATITVLAVLFKSFFGLGLTYSQILLIALASVLILLLIRALIYQYKRKTDPLFNFDETFKQYKRRK